MAKKVMEVEACEFCDEYKTLHTCSICGKEVCSKHSTHFKCECPKYPFDQLHICVCDACKQKPIGELLDVVRGEQDLSLRLRAAPMRTRT